MNLFQQDIYAGVGSRETPEPVQYAMIKIAGMLASEDYTLRSGGAEGADQAFEQGCKSANGKAEIYVPWEKYEQDAPSSIASARIMPTAKQFAEAYHLVAKTHPAAGSLTQGMVKLHTRNAFQVLGLGLNKPVRFVLCWTKDGCESSKTRSRATGGTGTAIAIAELFGIPVINLFNDGWKARLKELV